MSLSTGVLAVLATAAAAVGAAACGGSEPTGSAFPGAPPAPVAETAWRAVPAGPLSPRQYTLGLWTGSEVLLIGGSDGPPCPPSAECAIPATPPLADGAAYDPAYGTWRPIAESPVPFDWAEGVVVGDTAYLWIPGNEYRPGAERAFLGYRIDQDRWEELPSPPPESTAGILAVGERIVAYSGSDELATVPDLIFDPATRAWSELPDDPLGPSFDRTMAWSGRELVLFDHELVRNPGSEEPAITRAAALDLETGVWRRLPDSEILATGPWILAEGRLVNPLLGGADGGEVNNWGRTYPYGGILDPATGEWSPLPETSFPQDDFSGAGALTEDGGHYFGYRTWILDTTAGAWIEIPPLDEVEFIQRSTVVAAGDDLLVFGGVRWPDRSAWEGELLADAWIWSPRG